MQLTCSMYGCCVTCMVVCFMQLRIVRPANQHHSILNFFPKKGQPIPTLMAPPKPAVPPKKARMIPVTRVQKSAPPTKKKADASEKISKLKRKLSSKYAEGDLNVTAEKFKKWNGTVLFFCFACIFCMPCYNFIFTLLFV